MDAMEQMILNGMVEGAKEEYELRIYNTMDSIASRPGRKGETPIEAKVAAHVHLMASNLFHACLLESGEHRVEERMNQQLDMIVAACLAYKVLMARRQVEEMMGG